MKCAEEVTGAKEGSERLGFALVNTGKLPDFYFRDGEALLSSEWHGRVTFVSSILLQCGSHFKTVLYIQDSHKVFSYVAYVYRVLNSVSLYNV